MRSIAIVSSVIANKHRNGGNAWVILSWVLGLERLGYDTYFIEQIEPAACVDLMGKITAFETSENLAYFKLVTEQFGLSGHAALVYDNGAQCYGLTPAALNDLADATDLLINITGHLSVERLKSRPHKKVYVDLDPGFTQFWHAAGTDGARLAGHDYYFTIGENIGTPGCSIPTGNLPWRTTRQPVVLPLWSVAISTPPVRFTSVASWRGPYGAVTYGGKTYGLKAHEFRKVIDLPARTGQSFELALDIHPAEEKDLLLLGSHGWQLVDPRQVVPDPEAFRRYVRGSAAEFSVAQGVYGETLSGWFSDRTVRYLASGKPALVQDTGFSRNYPVGEGLIGFCTLEEAVAGAEAIARDYERHSRAARALAEEYFDSDKVLTNLLERVGVAP